MKILIKALLFFTSTAFAYDINRGGVLIPEPDDGYAGPLPYWFGFYYFGGLWLCLNKKSPLYEWANENAVTSVTLFMFILPAILYWILEL